MLHCQTFKQKIKELEIKTQNIEALLSEYKNTENEQIAQRFERELDNILQEIEKFKQEFKTQATQLIEEFVQRRENKYKKVEIIFDEKDVRFIIKGDLNFSSRTHLDDFPNLIKEITGNFWPQKAKTINLPNLEKIGGDFHAENAQTINLPNLKEVGGYFDAFTIQTINLPNLKEVGGYFGADNAKTINLPNLEKIRGNFIAYKNQTINLPNLKDIGGDIYFNEDNSNLNSIVELAREWRAKGILKGKIKIFNEKGNLVQEF
jgi:hypothetical protein